MKLKRILAKNYKGYSNLELELNTINILIGKNGSGKSTILRLVPLIVESIIHNNLGPLKLNAAGIDIGGRFSDLSKNHRESAILTLGASFVNNNDEISFSTSMVHDNEINRIVVKSFELSINNKKKIDLEFCFEKEVDSLNEKLFLDQTLNEKVVVEFSGLLPAKTDSYIHNLLMKDKALNAFYNEISNISSNISYLGPFRKKLCRLYAFKHDIYHIGPDGENAPYLLCNDHNKLNSCLNEKIKDWMIKNFSGKFISVKTDLLGFSLVVNKEDLQNNIVDDGVGFSQLLPLLVNRLSNTQYKTGKSSIEIVEQPELHLHPAACGGIADLYLTALQNSNNTIILETHSKEILLRLRRRIAEEKNSNMHEKINIIYTWKESQSCKTEYIKVSDNGELSWWPEGIFEESFEEVVAISEANNAN